MTMRFREGYKKHLQRRTKERNFKRLIKQEYLHITRINYYSSYTFNGYYLDERGTIKQGNKYSKRYWFKNPRYYRRVRRRYFNKDVGDVDMTSFGRNYKKVSRKS